MATRLSVTPPNLPIAPREYEQRYQEQLNNVQRLFYTGISNAVNLPYPYGSYFTAPANITNPVANAMNLVSFATAAETYNTAIGPIKSRIYVAETAVYNIQFSAQLDKTGGGASAAYFWLRKNGKNVADTAGKLVVNGPNSETMAAWNYVISLQAGDYVELAWASSDTALFIAYEAANTVRPAVPAVIFTIVWASSLNVSVGQS